MGEDWEWFWRRCCLFPCCRGGLSLAQEGEIYENFDNLTAGQIPDGWTKSVKGEGNAVGAVAEGDGMAMQIHAPTVGSEVLLKSPTFDFDRFTVQYRVKFENTIPYQGLYGAQMDENVSGALAFHMAGGYFSFRKNTTSTQCMKAEANRWYDVKLIVDNKSFVAELWIDGNFITKGEHFRNNVPVSMLAFHISTNEAAGYVIDDVSVQAGGEFSTPSAAMDFSSAVTDDVETFYPEGSDAATFISGGNLTHLDIETGKFGKSAQDKSLSFRNDAGQLTSGTADPYIIFDLKKTAAASPLAAGETAALDVNVAFGEEMSEIRFQGFAYSEDAAGDGKLGYDMILLSADGKLQILGQDHLLPTSMEPDVWHNIHLEVYAGDAAQDDPNRYSVWFDGEAVALDTAFDLKTRGADRQFTLRNQFRGFHQIWINHRFNMLQQEDGSYSAGGFYCDDLRYSTAAESQPPVEVALSHEDDRLNQYIHYPYGIFLDESVTAEQLKAIQVTNGQLIALRDGEGKEITGGALEGGYLDIMDYDCRHTYVPLRSGQAPWQVDGSAITLAADLSDSGNWIGYNNTRGEGSYSAAGPLGGKEQGDLSYVLVGGSERNQNSDTDFLNYVLQAADERVPACSLPMTMEYSFYVEEGVAQFVMQLYFDGATLGADAKQIFAVQNGQLASGDEAAACNIGWNRVAVSTYPGKKYVDVFLNGAFVGRTNTSVYHYVNMIRLAAAQSVVGAVTALDDFSFYSGAYAPAQRPHAVAKGEAAQVDEEEKTITIYAEEGALGAITDYLQLECESYTLYTDAALSEQAQGAVAQGNVLVLRRGKEFASYVIRLYAPLEEALYYQGAQLLDGENEAVSFDDLTPGRRTYQISDLLNNTGDTQEVTVALALYDEDGRLKDIAVSERVNLPAGETRGMLTVSLIVPQGLENGSLRLFTWNNLEQLQPVTLKKNPNELENRTQFTPVLDTWVQEGVNTPMAQEETLTIIGDGTGGGALLAFDFHQFGANAADSALLRLYVKENAYPQGANYRYLKIYAAEGELTEATVVAGAPREKTYLGKIPVYADSRGEWLSCNITDYVNRCMDEKAIVLFLKFEGMFNVAEGFSLGISSAESENPPQLVLSGSEKPFDLEEMLSPDWEGDVIYNESVLPMLYEGEEQARAMLAMDAAQILSVTDDTGKTVYEPGRDYIYQDGALLIPEGSTISFSTISATYQEAGESKTLTGKINDASILYSPYPVSGFKTRDGKYILFRENAFHRDQLLVTYRRDESGTWGGGCLPEKGQGAKLSTTMEKLKNGQELRMVVYGSSTSADACASAEMNAAPSLPGWGSLIEHALSDYYQTDAITYYNMAHGGKSTSTLGVPGAEEVAALRPDLVILGFLTNETVSREEYKANVLAIMDQVRKENPAAEFILFSSKVSHNQYGGYDRISDYKEALAEIAKEDAHSVYLDIQGVHTWLLERKNYESITGNNINHPNDYIHRIYAKMALEVLLPEQEN